MEPPQGFEATGTPAAPAAEPAADARSDHPDAIARDVALVGALAIVPSLLDILCSQTGMGFAAVARVTEGSWTACAVEDRIGFGLKPGGQLPVGSTLCREVREARQPVVIDHASRDTVYCNHHTPRTYQIESYVSVPIVLADGSYFGNLCAIDPKPAQVSDPATVAMFTAYAQLIGHQLDHEASHQRTADALLDAQSVAELREQFIAVLGHDLRTPLSAITMLGQLLVKGGASVDPVRTGERILSSSRRMSALIDDVLDFTRGRLGTGIGVHLQQQVDLQAALGDVVRELRDAHPQRVIIDHIELPEPVACDRARIQQLLSNLMSNALHHGAPNLPVLVEARIEDAQSVMICVANAGEPIAPEHLPRIFEPYWRRPDSHPGGGLGLGLHICARIVEAHGGTLEVASSAQDGTRFVARLPMR